MVSERHVSVHDTNGFIARVDFVYEGVRLIIEADSYKHHGSRRGWENDNVRRGRLVALGYRVLPVTWRMQTERPWEVQSLVRRSLANIT